MRRKQSKKPRPGRSSDRVEEPIERDFVDHLLDEWRLHAPGLDVTPFAIIVRMKRATAIFDKAREHLGAPHGLGGGEIMVLDALRRAGPPHCLNPRRLLEELLAPSGTMTSWIDRLARRGFVKRMPDPDDRRGVLVQLRARGRRIVSGIDDMSQSDWRGMPEHAAMAQLPREELNTLADLLRKLTLALEKAPSNALRPVPRPARARSADRKQVSTSDADVEIEIF